MIREPVSSSIAMGVIAVSWLVEPYISKPVMTSVAECNNVLTGVGPSIASGSHNHVRSNIDLPESDNSMMSAIHGSVMYDRKCSQYSLARRINSSRSVSLLMVSAINPPLSAQHLCR